MSTTLFRRGRVRSPVSPFATALVVGDGGEAGGWSGVGAGGTVVWVGEEGAADAVGADRVVDCQDALVAPAFVDAHLHATAAGLALTGLDLAAAPTLAAALDAVERAARGSDGTVLLGHGWDETRWPERRPPTVAELHRATGGRPAYLSRADLHSAVATADLLTGVRHDEGRVRLADHHTVRSRALAAVGPGQARAAQRATRAEAGRLGIGCLHEMAGPEVSSAVDLAALIALAAEEPGPDIVAYWGELDGITTALELGAQAGGDLFCDGSFGSHTAALAAPYSDDASTSGVLRYDAEDVARHAVAATHAGLQVGFHAIGDRALASVVAGLTAAAEQVGGPALAALRPRVEHAELLHAEQIAGLARLGAVASVQPAFDARWAREMYVERLGGQRAAASNPFAALAAAGVALALGSDAPVTPLDPWGGVRAAVGCTHPLSARAAFAAHTRGGWRAALADGGGAGELVPGAPATFAIWAVPGELVVQVPDGRVAGWSTDPRGAVAGLPDLGAGVPDPVCLRTVVRGCSVYDSGVLA